MKMNSLDQININLNSSRIESLEKTIDNILKELHDKHQITLDLMNYSSDKIEEILGEDDELNINYLSLYDFLGRGAGKELGGKIDTEAKKHGVEILKREVSNPKWKGDVSLYPQYFLEDLRAKGKL